MQQKRINNCQQSNFEEILVKGLLYYILGARLGLKGNARVTCALLGPIGESLTKIPLLESIGEALGRQERQKILDELELKISQDLESLFSFSNKNNIIESGESPSPLGTLSDKNPTIVTSTDSILKTEKCDMWREVIKHPAIVLVLGGRGSGKSAVSYRVTEDFRYSLSPYVVGFPEHSKELLPDWIGIERKLEDVPPKSISIVDEAYLSHHAREWQKIENRDICRLLNLSRQQDKTIIFVAQLSRQLDIDITSSADVLIIKNPGMLQTKFDRPEFRDILTEAKEAFQTVKGDIRRWSYVYSQGANFSGLIENELPTFWRPELSKVYANSGDMALSRLSPEMTHEEKKQKAKELHEAGWPLSRIAKYLGVDSKGTIFNWIHDYPYKGE